MCFSGFKEIGSSRIIQWRIHLYGRLIHFVILCHLQHNARWTWTQLMVPCGLQLFQCSSLFYSNVYLLNLRSTNYLISFAEIYMYMKENPHVSSVYLAKTIYHLWLIPVNIVKSVKWGLLSGKDKTTVSNWIIINYY